MHGGPLFDAAPVAGLSVRELGKDGERGLEIEAERGLILKQDHDGPNGGVNLHGFNHLAFDFRETQKACARFARVCTLVSSHGSPFLGR